MIGNNVVTKKEEPAYQTDQVYTRLFGKGEHNIHQFSDQELRNISGKAEKKEYNKVTVSFHNVKMYKDAARYKTYKETEKFPSITRYRGLESLRAVLNEDSKFPTSKETLIKDQGWKLTPKFAFCENYKRKSKYDPRTNE